PFRQAEFDIMYGQGISREGSLLDVGVDLGIIKKSGAWFTYEGEQLGQGRENVKKFLTENVDLMFEISEKIKVEAGITEVDLLAAEGMEPTDDLAEADVVVFNTCCIRENADNKLYGHLGELKSLKQQRPDLQIAVGGCLAQKDRDLVRAKAPHVDVVFGTHNL